MIRLHRTLLRSAVALCAALACWLLTSTAAAQIMVTMEPDAFDGVDERYVAGQSHCRGTAAWRWVFGGLNDGENVEVWASESGDCTLASERGGTGTCEPLGIQQTASNMSATVNVPVSVVAEPINGVEDCVDTTGGDSSRKITLYFLVDPGGSDVVNFFSQVVTLDLKGPPPPTGIDAGPFNETGLTVSWTAPMGTTEIDGYQVYCRAQSSTIGLGPKPQGGPGGMGGLGGMGGMGGMGGTAGMGGVAGQGGTGGTTGTGASMNTGGDPSAGGGGATGSCSHTDLTPGGEPPDDGFTSAGATDASADVTGLQTGVVYACAVATIDDLDNVGVLSELACAVPEAVDDFWQTYNGLSDAGGGFCRCAVVGAPVDAQLALLLSALAGLAIWLRRGRGGRA